MTYDNSENYQHLNSWIFEVSNNGENEITLKTIDMKIMIFLMVH